MKIEACPSLCIFVAQLVSWIFIFLWLTQVKAMRALQYFPTIEDPSTRKALFEVQFFSSKSLIYVLNSLSLLFMEISGPSADINGDRCCEKCE